MSQEEQEEQLFGIWNESRDRWARITPPYSIVKKYGYAYKGGANGWDATLFVSAVDVKVWFAELDNDCFRFQIRHKGYVSPSAEIKADRKRREEHAMRYL